MGEMTIPLHVELQVANAAAVDAQRLTAGEPCPYGYSSANSSQGGFIRVIAGSTSSINFPGTKGQITFVIRAEP